MCERRARVLRAPHPPTPQVAGWARMARSRCLIGISTRHPSRQLFCGGPATSGLFWLSPRDIWDTLVDHCLETNGWKGRVAPGRRTGGSDHTTDANSPKPYSK
ncbi:uncharacterized protein Dere_GG27287 [Drosophila erecta]|nr:uncharacterized protein Dere_GG27287 [Drosophila erecta]